MVDKEVNDSGNGVETVIEKIKSVFTNLLSSGDWGSSLFLKNSAAKLKKLKNDVEDIRNDVEDKDKEKVDENVLVGKDLTDYIKVYISLYQVEGNDLQGWLRTISSLEEHNVARPAYKDENYVKEFVRSKASGIGRNGYVIVNVSEGAVLESESKDAFGHSLLSLKEGAVRLENITEFIHANKKRYSLHDNELVLLGDINDV